MTQKFLIAPFEVLFDPNLNSDHILIFSFVISLGRSQKECYVSNSHFSSMTNRSISTVKKSLKYLSDNDYITMKFNNYSKNKTRRIITVCEKYIHYELVLGKQFSRVNLKEEGVEYEQGGSLNSTSIKLNNNNINNNNINNTSTNAGGKEISIENKFKSKTSKENDELSMTNNTIKDVDENYHQMENNTNSNASVDNNIKHQLMKEYSPARKKDFNSEYQYHNYIIDYSIHYLVNSTIYGGDIFNYVDDNTFIEDKFTSQEINKLNEALKEFNISFEFLSNY